MNRAIHYYDEVILTDLVSAEGLEEDLDITVTRDEEGMVIQFHMRYGKTEQLKVCDLNQAVGEEGIENLASLGFSREQTVALLSSAYSEEDIVFLTGLSCAREAEEYAAVLETNPEQLSVFMKNGWYQYSYILLEQGLEVAKDGTVTGQDLEQYKAFLNGVLYCCQFDGRNEDGTGYFAEGTEVPMNYSEAYLAILVGESDCALELTQSVLAEGYNQEEVVRDLVPVMNKQTAALSLYETLYDYRKNNIFCDIITWPNCYQIDSLTFAGSSLYSGGLGNCFELELRETLYDFEEPRRQISTGTLSPNQTEQRRERNNYIEKVKAAHWAVPKMLGDLTVEGASIFVPQIGLAVEALECITDAGQLVSAANSHIKEYSDNSTVKNISSMTKSTYSGIVDVCKAYQEREEAYAAILDDWSEGSIIRNENGKDVTLSNGRYWPETVLKMACFENEGICFVLGMTQEEGKKLLKKDIMNELVNKLDKQQFKGVDEKTKQDILSLVWCGTPYHEDCDMTVADIPANQIDDCIEKLSSRNELTGSNSADLDASFKSYNYLESYTGYVSKGEE